MAFNAGDMRSAEILEIRQKPSEEDSPRKYALAWRDTDGDPGESHSDLLSAFDGYKVGDKIVVYKTGQYDSWWERDLL